VLLLLLAEDPQPAITAAVVNGAKIARRLIGDLPAVSGLIA
jgi:hypothetical protein